MAFSLVGVAGPQLSAKVEKVVDGATLAVRIGDLFVSSFAGLSSGAAAVVRLVGVEVPADPAKASSAQELCALLVEEREVFVEVGEKIWDEKGRLLAFVFLDRAGRLMVNALLISTDLFSFKPVAGASRYDHILAHFDRTPGALPTLACSVVYMWNEAGRHVGETACVEGPVAGVGTSRGGDVFINVGRPYPDPNRFTLFIPARHVGKFEAAFGSRFWIDLPGRIVSARGEIRLYQGVPEIQLSEPENLVIR